MKTFKNPFALKKEKMNKQQENMQNEKVNQHAGNASAEELQLQSEVEASEQKPLEDNILEKLSAELAEQRDQHMRLYAEFDNFRKRSLKERADYLKSAGSDIVIALLPVMDDFERAIKASSSLEEKDPLKEGIILVYHKLKGILESKGLKAMTSIGTEFNVDVHEAVTNVPVTDSSMKGKVVDELEKGYWYNDKVIRHAKVVVGN
jgi:molecular chaperone GrpE